MGHTYVTASLEGPKSTERVKFLVDTGATYSIISEELAQKIGVVRLPRKFKSKLADGSEIEAEAGVAGIELEGRRAPITVLIMGCEEPLLGVETLEALGLKVNPETGELEPTRTYTIRA